MTCLSNNEDIFDCLHICLYLFQVMTCLSNNEDMFDYLHISDQFSGPKPSTE